MLEVPISDVYLRFVEVKDPGDINEIRVDPKMAQLRLIFNLVFQLTAFFLSVE